MHIPKRSSDLPDGARKLFDLLKRPGQDAQEVADLLLDLVRSVEGQEQQQEAVRELFGAVDQIADERRATVRQIIERFSRDPEQWNRIDESLRNQNREDLAVAIKRVQADLKDGLDRVANIVSGKAFDACSDLDIGAMAGELKAILETASRPPVVRSRSNEDPSDNKIAEPHDHPTEARPDNAADAFRRELVALFERYSSTLTSDQLETIVSSLVGSSREDVTSERGGE